MFFLRPHWKGRIIFFLLAAVTAAQGATYYVSTTGDDAASGRSPAEAWRSARKVSRTEFSAGDRVLFEGGKTFYGPVLFDRADGGDGARPVVVGTYGLKSAGRARIAAGTGRGIEVFNASGIRISDLEVVGDGDLINTQSGIVLLSTAKRGASHVRIKNVEVSGFGKYGISIGAWKTEVGYSDVVISGVNTHDNRRAGIFTWGPWGPGIYAHRGIHVRDSHAHGMKGGSGITFSSVDGGVVERCVAHNNGTEFSGAAGIWAWDSNDILLQFNESYGNRTIGVDGDGFDFDGGVTNSVMQYNYSHDNDAAGFLLAQYAFAPQAMKNIVIRYNISENDCRRKGYGAIHVWNNEDADRISDVQIYQNTIYLTAVENKLPRRVMSPLRASLHVLGVLASPGSTPSAITIISPTKSVTVQNNLFYTSGGGTLVSVAGEQDAIRFRNNAYWSDGSAFRVDWDGIRYHSLGQWLSAAGDQERQGEQILAIDQDPMLEAPGSGGTLGRPGLLRTLTGYKLRDGSPLIRRGMNLSTSPGIDPGSHGFFGAPVSADSAPSVGAHVTVDNL